MLPCYTVPSLLTRTKAKALPGRSTWMMKYIFLIFFLVFFHLSWTVRPCNHSRHGAPPSRLFCNYMILFLPQSSCVLCCLPWQFLSLQLSGLQCPSVWSGHIVLPSTQNRLSLISHIHHLLKCTLHHPHSKSSMLSDPLLMRNILINKWWLKAHLQVRKSYSYLLVLVQHCQHNYECKHCQLCQHTVLG